MMIKPELLAPAGSFEKARVAFACGADAVYVGIFYFGLRKHADNFTWRQLENCVALANSLGKKVYVVLNSFAHQGDRETLLKIFPELERIQPHGFIISDPGVMRLAKLHTSIDLHVSTQASVTNWQTCEFWRAQGATRVVTARELSMLELAEIRQKTAIEIEVFIHGSMCASYSGKCVISNYTAARDSNRGGCIQSCRHDYELYDSETRTYEQTARVMNAKDLLALDYLAEVMKIGIHSLKIEGRMKSVMYVATVVSAYRQAIDAIAEGDGDLQAIRRKLEAMPSRGFSDGAFGGRMEAQSIAYDARDQHGPYELLGIVKKDMPSRGHILQLIGKMSVGDQVEFFTDHGYEPMTVTVLRDMSDGELSQKGPNALVVVPWDPRLEHAVFVRKAR